MIKNTALVTGTFSLMIGLGYAFSPDYAKRELEDSYRYCNQLVEASGNSATTTFVYDKVKIQDGYHAGKTCRQVMEEYAKRP